MTQPIASILHQETIRRLSGDGAFEGGGEGRATLEAGRGGEDAVEGREAARAAPEGWSRVDTDQPLGAIAVYLCEPESDDGAVENGLIAAPAIGDEHPVWRVR